MKLRIATLSIWSLFSFPIFAGDLDNAPPPFDSDGTPAVPVDFQSVNVKFDFDYQARTATAVAEVEFYQEQAGYPFFDMVPSPTAIQLNGQDIEVSKFAVVADPDQATRVRVLKNMVQAGSTNILRVEYSITNHVSFTDGAIRAGFFMGDLEVGGRNFWEKYGPSSFEFDHFKQELVITFKGVTKEHEFFTNAEITPLEQNVWKLVFPDHYITSSFYLHFSEKGRFAVKKDIYQGLLADIPVTVYSSSMSQASSGMTTALTVLKELEGTYGPACHKQFVAYITESGGGMEYNGATMTSLGALDHELTHSWFARGVMPANGNAGWIDEAIASWRDHGYQRAVSAPDRSPVNLGGFSPYRRHTTMDAYTLGRRLIGEFDYMFQNFEHEGKNGMKGILRMMFAEKQHQVITVTEFKKFLEKLTSVDLTAIFERYVYGKAKSKELKDWQSVQWQERKNVLEINYHPRPYTKEELERYR